MSVGPGSTTAFSSVRPVEDLANNARNSSAVPHAKALAIADNRVGELDLEWDVDMLKQLHADGLDLSPFWLEKSQESDLVAARHLAQIRFAAMAVGTLLLGVVVFGAGAYLIAPSIGMPEVNSAIGGAVAWVALWIQLTHRRGQKLEAVREWSLHASFGRWRGWMWTGAVAVLLGVASNRIYDALKSTFGW